MDPTAAAIWAPDELLVRARAGQHAASDYLEDAVLAGVPTVGARRCGGGLAGTTYDSKCGPPPSWRPRERPGHAAAGGFGCGDSAGCGRAHIAGNVGCPTVARVVDGHGSISGIGVGHGGVNDVRASLGIGRTGGAGASRGASCKPGIPVIATVLEPVPAEDVSGERVAYFTTAAGAIHDRLRAARCPTTVAQRSPR